MDISGIVERACNARTTVIVPGSGMFGMEAVARQFATAQECLMLRNGWFSFRWTQILEMGRISADVAVLRVRSRHWRRRRLRRSSRPSGRSAPASSSRRTSRHRRASSCPTTASVSSALPSATWADCSCWTASRPVRCGWTWRPAMSTCSSAPRRRAGGVRRAAASWHSARAQERLEQTTSTSFACDLRKWLQVMEAYEQGGVAYHATMPTDALAADSAVAGIRPSCRAWRRMRFSPEPAH
jgi:hypothetical protein